MTPALGVRPAAHALPHHASAAHHLATYRRAAAADPPAGGGLQAKHTVMPHIPTACGAPGGYTVNCHVHEGHAVFVKLPVPVDGQRWVGVSTDEVDCHVLPDTPVSQCDSHGGK